MVGIVCPEQLKGQSLETLAVEHLGLCEKIPSTRFLVAQAASSGMVHQNIILVCPLVRRFLRPHRHKGM